MYYDKIGEKVRWLKQRPLLFFIIIHALLFLSVFANLDYLVGGHGFEHSFANKMLDGMLPYRDFNSEYPPLALFSFLLPALFFPDYPAYGFFYAVEIFLLDVVILFIMVKFTQRLNLRIWTVLIIYTLCLIAMGPIVTGRFDLLPAALVLVSLYAFISGRNKTAWSFLALGASAKLYPLIIVPLFILFMLYNRQYRRLVQGVIVFIGVLLALNLPWIIVSWDGYCNINNDASFLGYHIARELHSESSYGLVILMGQVMGLTQVDANLTYGSWNIISPTADALAIYTFYITFAFLAILYVIYIKRLLKTPLTSGIDARSTLGEISAQLIIRCSMLAVIIMLLTSKVFSPQFLIWLCPLIPLVNARRRYVPLVLFLVAAVITQYVYPHNYIEFELFNPPFVVMLFIRNLLLATMVVIYFLAAPLLLSKAEKVLGGNHLLI